MKVFVGTEALGGNSKIFGGNMKGLCVAPWHTKYTAGNETFEIWSKRDPTLQFAFNLFIIFN